MAQLYLVDTSAWIFALRRSAHEAIRRRIYELLESDIVATCCLVELELLGGTMTRQEFQRLRRRLQGLHRLVIEEDDWEAGADLAFSLRREGVTIPFTDALLSALAVKHETKILHADRDFDLVAKHTTLQVESLVNLVATSV